MTVSIIIPVLNEAPLIERLLYRLLEGGAEHITDLIVVDGGSTDGTQQLAQRAGAQLLHAPQRGRAKQMNYGVAHSTGELLYFVHGDTLPPKSYMQDVLQAVQEGFPIGGFRFKLDSPNPLLRINSWMTRFDFLWCRGGDQTLFVTRQLFHELGGYNPDFLIMEEYDLMIRARKNHPFKIIQKDVLVSARKYERNGYLRVQMANLVAFSMFRWGWPQAAIFQTYRKMLRQ